MSVEAKLKYLSITILVCLIYFNVTYYKPAIFLSYYDNRLFIGLMADAGAKQRFLFLSRQQYLE